MSVVTRTVKWTDNTDREKKERKDFKHLFTRQGDKEGRVKKYRDYNKRQKQIDNNKRNNNNHALIVVGGRLLDGRRMVLHFLLSRDYT